ncbi:MurR/RpiR family transcriptional regulator [Carnobacterium pleistocenium]|uniref:MurR/RpiR family transcriptional regulator n=1 Tax=Carnobacterium pleistocenium TaxID=181073 RepID=UPI0005554626|nr:MurR/RpiR family transcriptional regulator [Carnobacterium pleistocenium]
MAEINIFFKKLISKRKNLSNLESQVLEYILKYPYKVANLNIDEFSNEIFVSTATVSRTCKKLGFKGYQQLKYSLEQYNLNKETYPIEDNKIADIEVHVKRFQKEMENTLIDINNSKIALAAEYLSKSNLVEFFGVGVSFSFCSDSARKLTFAGRISSARNDWDELRAVANNMKPTDLAILLSHSGETLHLMEYANILKQRQVPFILLGGTQNSYIEKLADLTLTAYSESFYYNDIDMSSRFTINLLMDLIIFEYIKQNK